MKLLYIFVWMLLIAFVQNTTFAEEHTGYTIGKYHIKKLILEPNPPEVGDQVVAIILHDKSGNPITNAEVEIEAFMPEMGTMPFMSTKSMAEHTGNGYYEVELEVAMGGSWELPVRVKQANEESYTEFPFNMTIDIEGFIYKGQHGADGKTKSTRPSVYISEPRQQLIGVEIGQARYQNISRDIRTVARLEVDESRQYEVALKIGGYIEKLHANKIGELIQQGDPLFEIYSPELYTAQTEYLQLFQNPNHSRGTQALLKTAQEKLKLWDLSDTQIRELEKRGVANRRHTIYSPASGFILNKQLNEGSFVKAGQRLYQIADLSKLWALADIFEYEAFLVQEGNAASLKLSYLPSTPIEGEVSYIYPTIDPKTRTLKVRIEVENSGLKLRPGMYADVMIQVDQGEHLVIPRRAVMFSGKHKYVFVALGEGYFEPREIETGLQNGEWFEVTKGLKAGDHLSFSANFLISSEAKLRNALPRWGKSQKEQASESTPPPMHLHHH